MRLLGYAAVAIAAVATLFFVHALMPSTAAAGILIGAWLLLPYVLLAAALRWLARNPRSLRIYTTLAIAVAAGGIVFLTYVIYLSRDPQGAIAVFFTPIYQLASVAVLFPLCGWLFPKTRAS
ncbi:MAG TPA: hypothetical protein VM183_08135 [Burkholderiales bacterium]|nr:hypothetical protein [Burkholderiales bacterium]